jgi:seryl-tRNA(Sec) selenium transferase
VRSNRAGCANRAEALVVNGRNLCVEAAFEAPARERGGSYGRKVPGSTRLPSMVISTGSSIGLATLNGLAITSFRACNLANIASLRPRQPQ